MSVLLCQQCGRENEEGRRFCIYCGGALPPAGTAPAAIEVRGREHLPTVSYLLVSNHLHPIDPFILMAVLPDEPRLHFIAKQETVSVWWKRAILGAVGGIIPVSVGSRRSYQEMMSRASAVLEGGGVVGIFPEGRIGPEEGKLLPFRNGVGYLAIHGGGRPLCRWPFRAPASSIWAEKSR